MAQGRSPSFCHLCGKSLAGNHLSAGSTFRHPKWAPGVSLKVCADCSEQKPRCKVCRLPMAQSTPNGVCSECSQHESYCQACGDLLQSQYFEFAPGGGADHVRLYCQNCYRGRPLCDVCVAPLTDEQWRLSDGRVTCAHCHATAIYSPTAAVALYDEMKGVVAQILGLHLNVPTGLALVDRNQLANVIKKQRDKMRVSGTDPYSSTQDLDPQQTLGLYARQGMRRGIYVQTGLPRMLFLQVAAHEYAHAWQGENCPILREQLVHEGFAEWIAYRVLGHYNYRQGQERMREREDIYGQGLRWALELEKKQGAAGIIAACRNST